MTRYAVKMPENIYFVAHQDYDNWSPARFSPADIKYYHHDLVERLEAVNAKLLDACDKAATEFERLTGDNGFEPERFRERISIMHELNRAIVDARRAEVTG